MNFVKFWQAVEKNPWLPRVLFGSWRRLKRYPNDPRIIHDVFGIPTIRDEIGFIAFRPWQELDLNTPQTGVYVARSEVRKESTVRASQGMHHVIYWHTNGEESFVRSSNEEVNIPLTLRQMIDAVCAQGGTLDAVVRVITASFSEDPNMSADDSDADRVRKIMSDIRHGSSRVMASYEIFLPPPQQ